MARKAEDGYLRQRREKRLAVALANSCRMSRARRQEGARRGGLLAMAVPALLIILGVLAAAGILREYWI